jgi:hypothetical protein
MANIATKVKSVEPAALERELKGADAGLLSILPVATILSLDGVALTQPQIDAKLKAYIATMAAVDAAFQQYQAALVARRGMQLEARDFVLRLKGAVVAHLGSQNPQLAAFGFVPAKPLPVKTAAQNVLTAAKAQLTRKARGTMSKKQKLAIQPMEGKPAVQIGGDGNVQVIAPTVANAALPGSDGSNNDGK